MADENACNKIDFLFDQKFEELRDACCKANKMFVDPHFALDGAIDEVYDSDQCTWRRPKDIVKKPEFITDGVSRFDVNQGKMLGDCWFLAATASLSLNPELFSSVVPDGQSFLENYAGIFHFRFWRFGRWVDVVIDDLLPVKVDAEKNTIVRFTTSTDSNEFWISLLEKAYAKLNGSYNNIHGGVPRMALLDFTGGFVESYDLLQDVPLPGLFLRILHACRQGAIITGGILIQKDNREGMSGHHAYSITNAAVVGITNHDKTGKKRLIRVRNPHGTVGQEYDKGWADESKEWKYVSSATKADLDLDFKKDGEYWMSFRKFVKHFDILDICHTPRAIHGAPLRQLHKFEGQWTVDGVCGGNKAEYYTNPQFFVTLTDDATSDVIKTVEQSLDRTNESPTSLTPGDGNDTLLRAGNTEHSDDDEDKDGGSSDEEVEEESEISDEEGLLPEDVDGAKLTIMVDLLTKQSFSKTEHSSLKIGFDIYQLSNEHENGKKLDAEFFRTKSPIERVESSDIYCREVSGRFVIPQGDYCIVPYTCQPDRHPPFFTRDYHEPDRKQRNITKNNPAAMDRSFMLRVFIQAHVL